MPAGEAVQVAEQERRRNQHRRAASRSRDSRADAVGVETVDVAVGRRLTGRRAQREAHARAGAGAEALQEQRARRGRLRVGRRRTRVARQHVSGSLPSTPAVTVTGRSATHCTTSVDCPRASPSGRTVVAKVSSWGWGLTTSATLSVGRATSPPGKIPRCRAPCRRWSPRGIANGMRRVVVEAEDDAAEARAPGRLRNRQLGTTR